MLERRLRTHRRETHPRRSLTPHPPAPPPMHGDGAEVCQDARGSFTNQPGRLSA